MISSSVSDASISYWIASRFAAAGLDCVNTGISHPTSKPRLLCFNVRFESLLRSVSGQRCPAFEHSKTNLEGLIYIAHAYSRHHAINVPINLIEIQVGGGLVDGQDIR